MESKFKKRLTAILLVGIVGLIVPPAQAIRLAYWMLDETAGTIAYDSDGLSGATDCLLYGDAQWASGVVPDNLIGISRGSIYLDGDGDYLSCGSTSELNTKGGPFSIVLWIRAAQSTITNNATPIERGGQWRIGIYGSPRTIEFLTYSPGNTYTTGFTNLSDQQWHHLTAVYDGADAIVYIDGWEQDRNTIGGNYVDGVGVLRIGGPVISWGQYFNGWIDDVAIFNEALSFQEIQSVMQYGAGWFVGGNGPPYVDAGPYYQVVIKEQTGPTIHQLDGFAADKTVFEPNKLEHTWFQISGPSNLSFSDANDLNATIDFTTALAGEYRLGLHVTDGQLDANDYMIIDLKPSWWTGLTCWWAFEDNLAETIDSTNQGVAVNNLAKVNPQCLDPYFAPGIIGQAAYVGHNDGAGHFATFETPDSPDLELNRAFTIECYLKPRMYNPLVADRAQILSKWYIDDPQQFDWYFSYNCYLAHNEYMTMTIINPRDIDLPPTPYYTGILDTKLAHALFPAYSEWQHLAWVSDGTRTVEFWIDGILRDSYSFPIEEEYWEIKDTIAPLRIADGIMYDYRVYEGWIDEIKFWQYDKPEEYIKQRARLIPLQAPEPADEEVNVKTSVILTWSPAKGYDNPRYNVYFAPDGQSLRLVAQSISQNYYDPCQIGGALDLNNATKYNWRVDIVGPPGPPVTGPDWTFTTEAADYTGLIAHWKFEETTGTIFHDSAGCDDTAYFHPPDAENIIRPYGWVPEPPLTGGRAIQLRNFEYLRVEPCDPDVFTFLPGQDFTLSCWFKVVPPFFTNESEELIGKGSSYGLSRQSNSQNLEFYLNDAFAGDRIGGNRPVGDGYWHQAMATYIAPTRTAEGAGYLFVDGVLDSSAKVVDNFVPDEQNPLGLGKNFAEAYDFLGALDDARIYARAWTPADIPIPPIPTNYAPLVNAGDNTIIPYPDLALNLKTTIRDDILPLQQSPRISWMKIEGPGAVTFDPCIIELGDFPGGFIKNYDNVLTTHLTFSQPGFYLLRLKADDMIYHHYDHVRIWVRQAPAIGQTVAYWRFEEDAPETDWRGIPGADDPNTLIIANEIPGAPALTAERLETYDVPALHPTVPIPTIPLTGAPNTHHLGEGPGDYNHYGQRRINTGMNIEMQAQNYKGLVFCEDGITVEAWIKLDQPDWTVFDLEDNPNGLRIFNTQTGYVYNWSDVPAWDRVYRPADRLYLEFWLETSVPNEYSYQCLVSDIRTYQAGWKHIAFTYDKTTGIARVYEDGLPAWITHYFNENADDIDFYEFNPWIEFWQGQPKRALALPENLNLRLAADVDTYPSGLDELRITAQPLYPPQFLNVGPRLCTQTLKGDLDGDCDVDLIDLKLFCDQWLNCNNADPDQCFKNIIYY